MRKILLIAALMVLAMPLSAFAQKAEIFGGYSYLRADNCDVNDNPTICDGGTDLHGFNVSFNQNLVKWVGLKVDISGHYGERTILPGLRVDMNTYLFLAGPQFNLPKYERLRPYGHVLLGVVRTNLTTPSTFGRLSLRDSAFALAIGGGVDLKVNDLVAVRLFQADYILTRFDTGPRSATQNNFRTSTGLVLRFGED